MTVAVIAAVTPTAAPASATAARAVEHPAQPPQHVRRGLGDAVVDARPRPRQRLVELQGDRGGVGGAVPGLVVLGIPPRIGVRVADLGHGQGEDLGAGEAAGEPREPLDRRQRREGLVVLLAAAGDDPDHPEAPGSARPGRPQLAPRPQGPAVPRAGGRAPSPRAPFRGQRPSTASVGRVRGRPVRNPGSSG